MSKAKVVTILAFLITFGAGIVAGMAVRDHMAKPAERSWLGRELNLTPEQEEQMRTIWAGVRDGGRQAGDRREALRRERDEKVRALLTDEQKAAYEALLQDYAARSAELNKERDARYQEAVRRTKEILTPEQGVKYDELLKTRLSREHWRSGGSREPRKMEGPSATSGGT